MARWRRTACLAAAAIAPLGACGGGGGDEAGGGAPATASTSLPLVSTTTSSTTTASAPPPPPGGATTTVAPATAAAPAGVRLVTVAVRGGAVEGGARREPVELGERVLLRVTSDVADEVHVHGYDRRADVAAGGSVDLEFAADLPGVWEVELERRGLTLLELAVTP